MKPATLLVILILTQGCSHWEPFASFKPLLSTLDETQLSAKARGALAEARFDFELARKSQLPRYAHLISDDPKEGCKSYQGRGYLLTIFKDGPRHRVGQKIEVGPEITGGSTLRYDESHEQWD